MIHRIVIKNYKSLDVDFTLEPVTVLVGRSGTGKSNLVDALRFLGQLLRNGNTKEAQTDWGKILFKPSSESDAKIRFLIEYTVPVFSEKIEYQMTLNKSEHYGVVIATESLAIGKEIQFERISGKWSTPPKITPPPELQWNAVALPSLNGNQKISLAHLVLTDALSVYDFPTHLGTTPEAQNQQQQTAPGFAGNGSNFRKVFDDIRADMTRPHAWNDINAAMQRLNSSIENVDMTARRGGNMIVAHKFGDLIAPFPIEQESEGCRRFLAHLLALYQTPPKETLVFEEPENGIHPGALQTLADELKAAPEDKRGQVILTTHSPSLLDHFSPESIRVVEMENYRTRISPLAKEQLASLKEELLKPGELLTLTDARSDPSVPN